MYKFIEGKCYLFDLVGGKLLICQVSKTWEDSLRVVEKCKMEVSDSDWVPSPHGVVPGGVVKHNEFFETVLIKNISTFAVIDCSPGNNIFDFSREEVRKYLDTNGQEVDR